jgi:hypothetical protein
MGIAAKVKTNGELEDVRWQQGKQLALNYVTRPFEKTGAPVSIQVKIFEKGDILYVAFIA